MEEHLLFSNDLSRRVFIQGLGFVSAGLLLGIMGGCEQLAEAIKNRPVRRRLRTGSPEVDADIATYTQAVTAMKNLDSGGSPPPTSWLNQAAIHGVPAHFNFCEHGTDHFFDWHRAYLLFFERICQKLTGNAKFGLPYWNWNQDPAIHPAFLVSNSVLFSSRTRTTMAGISTVSTADLDPIFQDTNFFTFSHGIEGTPHNSTHSSIGGVFGGFASAQDPIFFMHHCMVDYCWAKWNIEMGNNNTNDSTWINHPNEHFVDTDGNPTSMNAGITILAPLLSYRYESSAIGSNPASAAAETVVEYRKVEARLKQGENIRFDIKQRIPIAEKASISIARPFSKETRVSSADFAQIVNSEANKNRIFASIEFAKAPPASDFYVRVFINLPDASSSTPTSDPHYAGSFAFFGTSAPEMAAEADTDPHHHPQPRFLVNLTNAVQRLRRQQELKEEAPISVQLVAVPFGDKLEKEDTQLDLEKIEIIVTPVIVNQPSQ